MTEERTSNERLASLEGKVDVMVSYIMNHLAGVPERMGRLEATINDIKWFIGLGIAVAVAVLSGVITILVKIVG